LFQHCIDFFIFADNHVDLDTLHRARILIGLLEVYFIILVSAAAFLWLFSPLDKQYVRIGCTITLSIAALFLILLIFHRRTGRFTLCCETTLAAAICVILFGIAITGGPIDSAVTPTLLIPAIMAFILEGRWLGNLWCLVIGTFLGTMIYYDLHGYHFIALIDPLRVRETRIGVICVDFVCILGLVLLYEITTNRLRRERDREHQRYVYQANHDSLTQLANRALFDTELDSKLLDDERREKGTFVALLFLDLNGFKPINDQFGHDVGDEVLKKVALRLRQNIRRDDLVARFGGDEFSIVAYDFKSEKELYAFAEKILLAIAAPMLLDNRELQVTGSLGIALFPRHAKDRAGLIKCADTAMYQSKMSGGGWHIYAFEDGNMPSTTASNDNPEFRSPL